MLFVLGLFLNSINVLLFSPIRCGPGRDHSPSCEHQSVGVVQSSFRSSLVLPMDQPMLLTWAGAFQYLHYLLYFA